MGADHQVEGCLHCGRHGKEGRVVVSQKTRRMTGWREITLGSKENRDAGREETDGKEQEKESVGDKQRFISV